MARIRPFRASDLEAVGRLLAANLPDPVPHSGFLESTLLDPPWRDDDISSLVAEEDGRVVGFIGAQVRRLRWEDRELRGVCCSHLVVDSSVRPSAAGVLLMRRVVTGPQDLTFSDTATDVVLRIWRALGGRPDHSRSLDWMLVLSPLRWARSLAGGMLRREPLWRDVLPAGAIPAQAIGPRMMARAFPEPEHDVTGEAATPGQITGASADTLVGVRFHAVHDEAYLGHLFRWLEPRGLVARIVRRGDRPVGWYAYVLRPGRTSRVLHVAAGVKDVDATLGELVAHARGAGSAALAGRLEPHLEDPLRRRAPALGFARVPLVHSRDPALLAALASSGAILSQLDGEWFLI
jgi:hypothetical protein